MTYDTYRADRLNNKIEVVGDVLIQLESSLRDAETGKIHKVA